MPKYFQKVAEENLSKRAIKNYKVGRNEFFPCKNGKKFKKCCLV